MRIAFAGTPVFASRALAQILAAGFEVPLVLTQPDRPAGRGLKLQASPVKLLAMEHGITVLQPRSLKLAGSSAEEALSAQQALAAAQVDVMVVVAYGLILPAWALALPPRGCLNIHASLLPRWRGAAPIHRAIEAGDAQTGVCIMQMEEGLDTGAVLLTHAEAILAGDTTGSLHDRLAEQGARRVVDVLKAMERGEPGLLARPQPSAGVSYAHKVDKAEAAIDWRESAEQIERRVRAFDPFPGAHFFWRDEAVKLWGANLVPASGEPGTVVASGPLPVVACGSGGLQLVHVQQAGGRRVAARELFGDMGLAVGDSLSGTKLSGAR